MKIASYGNLIKTYSFELAAEPSTPSLFNEDGGYVEADCLIARKSGSEYDKIRIITSIGVNVVNPSSNGTVVNYGSCVGTYETGAYKRLESI